LELLDQTGVVNPEKTKALVTEVDELAAIL
jgi:hypothetical protein